MNCVDWHKLPDEDWVVTGFFDFQDTLISLAHITEELWGGHVPDPFAPGADYEKCIPETGQSGQKVVEKVQKTMREGLELLKKRPKAVSSHELFKELETESEYLSSAPELIKEAFVDVINLGGKVIEIGGVKTSIFEAMTEISQFVVNPIDWLLTRLLGWSPIWLQEKLRKAIVFYSKERVYDSMGANRIGCHSLLAKDHGLEPLYQYQKECATAVHGYIVKTLLRWSPDKDNDYIDWLELLEYFLSNPGRSKDSAYREKATYEPTVKVHIIKKGEQLKARNPVFSLEDKYKPTALEPSKFTWRTIADHNFNTYGLTNKAAAEVINQILRDRGWGESVRPPNYAFKPGIPIRIPNQKGNKGKLVLKEEPQWWEEVMNKGWQILIGYSDEKTGMSYPPLQPHIPQRISKYELDKLISEGWCLRMEARESYRPDKNGQFSFYHSKLVECLPMLAEEILKHRNITLAKTHESGVPDDANAYQHPRYKEGEKGSPKCIR